MSTAHKLNVPDNRDIDEFLRALKANGYPIPSFEKTRSPGKIDTISKIPYDYRVKEDLKSNPDFRRAAEENQWASRKDRGLPSHTCIFEFLKAVYEPWLSKGMTQADLRSVDQPAYKQLRNRLDRDKVPMPSTPDLPTGPEARMRAQLTVEDRLRLTHHREYQNSYMREARARRPTLT